MVWRTCVGSTVVLTSGPRETKYPTQKFVVSEKEDPDTFPPA